MTSNARWFKPPDHAERRRYAETLCNKTKRFVVNHAGRRSWKTETAKRALVWTARNTAGCNYLVGAPVQAQAKRIFWKDLNALARGDSIIEKSDGDLWFRFPSGSMIQVAGMDRPDRFEGLPWHGALLDEYGNMHARVLEETILPMLADTKGFLWATGVPEGRNHYFDLATAIKAGRWRKSESAVFHWPSSDMMDPAELEEMKSVYDEQMFAQEFGGEFVHFAGRAYHAYSDERYPKGSCFEAREFYNPRAELIFCFDFNVSPGPANVLQEMRIGYERQFASDVTFEGVAAIGEVHIPEHSNTERVARRLLEDWGPHMGKVTCYGDFTGGSSGSAKLLGSDWQIIEEVLRPVFGDRLSFNVKPNPRERDRVNAVNSMLKATDGSRRFIVDPVACPHLARDFEGVSILEGSAGELDKRPSGKNKGLTHHSDAVGYYLYLQQKNAVRKVSASRVGKLI